MDHSDSDKRFCVYIHKDQEGNIRYVGSGTDKRVNAVDGRTKAHLLEWGSLVKEKIADNLSKIEASELEVKLINELWDSKLLLNKRRSSTLAKPIIYEDIKDLLEYDETSPSFLRIKSNKRGNRSVGAVAGHLSASSGYWVCCINYKTYKVHRLIWSLLNKQDLTSNLVIDHIDRNNSNNNISNLRLVTTQSNSENRGCVINAEYIHIHWHNVRKFYSMRVYSGTMRDSAFVTKSFNPSILFPDDCIEEAKNKTLVLVNYVKEVIKQQKELCCGNLDIRWLKDVAFNIVKRNKPFNQDISIYKL